MSRIDILNYIKPELLGLEIGPSYGPMAPKKKGFNCEILDYVDTNALIEGYKGHPGVDISNIEEVDYVCTGERYPDLIGKKDYYDYIISCHSIEHTTDLISFLQDCSALLKDTGILLLIIPDKRVCFDRFRPVTSIAKVIDDYVHKYKIHSAGEVVENILYSVRLAGNTSFQEVRSGEFEFDHLTIPGAIDCMNRVAENGEFINIHNYVFTPSSFQLIVEDLNRMELIDLVITESFPPTGNEFYKVLSKSKEKLDVNPLQRMETFKNIEKELLEQYIEETK